MDGALLGPEGIFVWFIAGQEIVGSIALLNRASNAVAVKHQARGNATISLVAPGHIEKHRLLDRVRKQRQCANRLFQVPKNWQKQRTVLPCIEEKLPAAPQDGGRVFLPRRPFDAPEPEQDFYIALDCGSIRMGNAEVVGVLHPPRKPPHLLARVGAEIALEEEVPGLGELGGKADGIVDIVSRIDVPEFSKIQFLVLKFSNERTQPLLGHPKVFQTEFGPMH